MSFYISKFLDPSSQSHQNKLVWVDLFPEIIDPPPYIDSPTRVYLDGATGPRVCLKALFSLRLLSSVAAISARQEQDNPRLI